MISFSSSFTVFFEDPFWVGVFERTYSGKYEAAKIVFGAEPANSQIYEYISKNWCRLRFSPCVTEKKTDQRKISPKRIQREIHKQMDGPFSGTKSQQALKLQQEQSKLERKALSRDIREAEKEKQFLIRQEKKLKKHKGH